MSSQKFSIMHYPINFILQWIRMGDVVIPEIQRPFVWEPRQVRDLIDSLYRGYPIGYVIVWQNPNVRTKEGFISSGKKILIDGQQRLIALKSSLLGEEIINSEYEKVRIVIGFNPMERIFEVSNASIQKDKRWIHDISTLFSSVPNIYDVVNNYLKVNSDLRDDGINGKGVEAYISESIQLILNIVNTHVGVIELDPSLDIEEVTDIFVRINSSGKILSQADFAMTKMAVSEKFGGHIMRKCIDYFCNVVFDPEFFESIKKDSEFKDTEYFRKMEWLSRDTSDSIKVYIPSYSDILRVSFTYEFERGKLKDLVALLSGKDFKTGEYSEDIIETTLNRLRMSVLSFINETNFKNFVMIINSIGFVDNSLIPSVNALNFAYILYLKLKDMGIKSPKIQSIVSKWFVLSILKSRYSSSAESKFEQDINKIKNNLNYIDETISAELSDVFWGVGLVQNLETSNTKGPEFCTFIASQIKMNDCGFLSRTKVRELIKIIGDYHHIFPKDYLKNRGFNDKKKYNQIANLVVANSEINREISNKAPKIYFSELKQQCVTGQIKYKTVGITDSDELKENLIQNCIPLEVFNDDFDNDYENFLIERRKLIAQKIKKYFKTL